MARASTKKRPASAAGSRVRCAIYTRKSTEEGLEQAFNSLDAQREACAAYIMSQVHEGWSLVRDAYDDGGFSGGTMERPGLRRLLGDVEAGRVDVIVVYKVDRLTRSLADFAKIVEVLDARGASFVSVTQAFNTTTSMGRLTLNVLLSFAQFEREVTGERIRDKIAASKKKGMWMGGPVPLGYRVEDRKLVVDEADAVTVRHIFRRYVALGTGQALIEELRATGYRTKLHLRPGKPPRGGVPFGRGMLFVMLANRIYVGDMVHKGQAHKGEHPAIIEDELWEQVQATIAANSVVRASGSNHKAPSLLVGILHDGLGRRMSPSHAMKGGKRYRYYVTPAAACDDATPAWRLPATDVEQATVTILHELLADRQLIRTLGDAAGAQAISAALTLAAQAAKSLDNSHGRRTLVGKLVERVDLDDEEVSVIIQRTALQHQLQLPSSDGEDIVRHALALRIRRGKDVKLIIADADGLATKRDERLAALMVEAAAARDAVMAEPEQSLKAIATARGQCRTRFAQLVRLSWISPAIVEAIASGQHPKALTPRKLLALDLPPGWRAQEQLVARA